MNRLFFPGYLDVFSQIGTLVVRDQPGWNSCCGFRRLGCRGFARLFLVLPDDRGVDWLLLRDRRHFTHLFPLFRSCCGCYGLHITVSIWIAISITGVALRKHPSDHEPWPAAVGSKRAVFESWDSLITSSRRGRSPAVMWRGAAVYFPSAIFGASAMSIWSSPSSLCLTLWPLSVGRGGRHLATAVLIHWVADSISNLETGRVHKQT